MAAKELSTPDIPGFFIQSNLDADYIHLAASGLTTCKNGIAILTAKGRHLAMEELGLNRET